MTAGVGGSGTSRQRFEFIFRGFLESVIPKTWYHSDGLNASVLPAKAYKSERIKRKKCLGEFNSVFSIFLAFPTDAVGIPRSRQPQSPVSDTKTKRQAHGKGPQIIQHVVFHCGEKRPRAGAGREVPPLIASNKTFSHNIIYVLLSE